MYAPGYPQSVPPRVPGRAWIVSMRVLFCALSVFSIGMFLWAPLLRLAFVRRRAFDWWMAAGGFAFVVAIVMGIGRDQHEAHGIDFVLIPLLLLAMLIAPVYYLVADIRHYGQRGAKQHAVGGYVPPTPGYAYATTTPVTGKPGPAPQPPHQQQTFPQQPFSQQQYGQRQSPPQTPTPPLTPTPPHPPYPQQPHPQPQRIDQVRAELDELSDYLRKEEGR
ncbi:hypothetical protein [Streptomyces sp. NPDC048445]|uniref:hypothetical protein n=1 Tax=Streptomyces sp. NPDC048445 TaxID=3365553 RepID=UPI00371C7B7E